jgi:putative transposase
MSYYQRTLPHWHPDGAPLFLTWRLFGSLPAPAPDSYPTQPGRAFVLIDRCLDRADFGPQWLRDDRIARRMVDAFNYGQQVLEFYKLYAYVIMLNHVHILLQPDVPLARITKSIKGYTAREANLLLKRTGSPFWQYESYDHWVRNEREFHKITAYIENNPVSAGFVSRPEDWRWSSAHVE